MYCGDGLWIDKWCKRLVRSQYHFIKFADIKLISKCLSNLTPEVLSGSSQVQTTQSEFGGEWLGSHS